MEQPWQLSHRKSCSEGSQKILFWWMRSPRTSWTKSSKSYYMRNIKDYNCWKLVIGQRPWNYEYICVADWGWRTTSRMPCKKLPRNWRIEKMLLSRGNSKNNENWKNFLRNKIRNHEHWVFSSTILTCWAVMTNLRSSSGSYYVEFKQAEPRSWNAAKYMREYEYSWKCFWLSTCSTRSWWIKQLFKKFGNTIGNRWRILRKQGIENSGSEEPLQSIPLPCFSVRSRRKRLDDKWVLCLWLTMPWVFGLVLKWHDDSESSPLVRCIYHSLTE